jgi:hypothetical protein
VISRHELPEDAADWATVAISFPRLPEDAPGSCPCPADEIFEYVQNESSDLEGADRSRLVFVRTAQVADAQYWLWSYTEVDGEDLFVTCRVDADGATTVGLAARNGLSAEQFILAEYYDEVYWS